MAASTAGANKIAVLDKLKSILDGISDFTGQVYVGYRPPKAVKVDKHILVHLVQDSYVERTSAENVHNLQFNVLVKYRTDVKENPETIMEAFIDLVGKVEDELKTNAYVGGVWEDLAIDSIHYTFGQERQVVFYNGMMIVRVRTQW